MSSVALELPVTTRPRPIGRRVVAGGMAILLVTAIAATVVSTTLVPAGTDGLRGRIYNGWYATAALIGLTLDDGQYQLDDARRLVELDPGLGGYFGTRGAEFLVANSPDAAERVALAARLDRAGHDGNWLGVVRDALLDTDADVTTVLSAAATVAQDLGAEASKSLADVLLADDIVVVHGIVVVEAALAVHESPKTLTAVALATSDPLRRLELLTKVQDISPGDPLSAGHLAVLAKQAAIEANNRPAAEHAHHLLATAIDAMGDDAPPEWHAALSTSLPTPVEKDVIILLDACCGCGCR